VASTGVIDAGGLLTTKQMPVMSATSAAALLVGTATIGSKAVAGMASPARQRHAEWRAATGSRVVLERRSVPPADDQGRRSLVMVAGRASHCAAKVFGGQ
jgi:hypothetical protein